MWNRILDILGGLGLIIILKGIGYFCYWHASLIDAMALGGI